MNIFISNNDCHDASSLRLGNHIYPILVGLTFYENIIEQHPNEVVNIYFCNECENIYNNKRKVSEFFISNFPLLKNRINFITYDNFETLFNASDTIAYTKLDINNVSTNKDIYIQGFCQTITYIDFNKIRYYFLDSPVFDYIKQIYGDDIDEYVSIHIRRGDYLRFGNQTVYFTLDKKYILNVIQNYFNDDKFIIISDDIKWCKENLSDISINGVKFADAQHPGYMSEIYMLVDLCIPIITKGNIASPSSFGMFGASINPNKNMVVNTPYYKKMELNNDDTLNIVPSWAKRQPII